MRHLLLPPSLLILVSAAALAGSPASSAPPVDETVTVWTYDPASHQLVAEDDATPEADQVAAPFSIHGGHPVVGDAGPDDAGPDEAGLAAVALTRASALATYTGTSFPVAGDRDFRWTVEMSVDRLHRRSSPNVAQHGLYREDQIKVQLNRWGVPQCVFHGDLARKVVTSDRTVNDGAKHSLSCWRVGDQLGVSVDGTSTATTFNVGSVAPQRPPTVGNKSSRGGARDQLFGRIWSLSVAIGGGLEG